MNAQTMLDERMISALTDAIKDAEAKNQKKRLRFLVARLAEVKAASGR